jgi:hypothetical protein
MVEPCRSSSSTWQLGKRNILPAETTTNLLELVRSLSPCLAALAPPCLC